jgi:hypothetical protein
MLNSEILGLLIASAFFILGGFLGLLGNWLISTQKQEGWTYVFYIISGAFIILAIVLAFSFWNEINNWLGISFLIILLFGALATIIFIKKKIQAKNIYSTEEAGPRINEFTELADTNEIKLFGGDLNFFGKSQSEIDSNSQYIKLRTKEFSRINIICEEPRSLETRLRYGKILTDLPQTELRFYNPEHADLRIRGRIAKVSGSSRLLMFNKLKPKTYQIIQTDTSNSSGAMYENIWKLVWDLATKVKEEETRSFKKLYSEQ